MDNKDSQLSLDVRRNRVHKAVNQVPLSASVSKYGKENVDFYYQDLLHQSKRLSQLIAYSWMSDADVESLKQDKEFTLAIHVNKPPSEIASILQRARSDEIKEMLREQANVNLDDSLGPNSRVNVDWNVFDGSVEAQDATAVSVKDEWYTANLPYPPRPGCVKDWQLQEWVSNDKHGEYGPPYPYIPLSTGS